MQKNKKAIITANGEKSVNISFKELLDGDFKTKIGVWIEESNSLDEIDKNKLLENLKDLYSTIKINNKNLKPNIAIHELDDIQLDKIQPDEPVYEKKNRIFQNTFKNQKEKNFQQWFMHGGPKPF